MHETRVPRERRRNRSAIAEIDSHRVIVDGDVVAAGTMISVAEEFIPSLQKLLAMLDDQRMDPPDFRAPKVAASRQSRWIQPQFCHFVPASAGYSGGREAARSVSLRCREFDPLCVGHTA